MRPRIGKWLWTIAIALPLVWFVSKGWVEEKHSSGREVAVVNGSIITQQDFDDEISRVQQMLLNRGMAVSDSQLSEIKREVLENLISRELLYQESRKKGIEVDEVAVDGQLRALKQRFPSEVEFKETLSRMNLSEEAVKSQMRREMAVQQLIHEQFAGKVTVSDDESKTYYDDHPSLFKQPEEVRASHILIKVDPTADESQRAEARKKIEKIQERLQKGEDFATLAKELSQGPSSARGGDLNYFGRGQMVKPFEDVAFTLEPGEVSDIIETRFGYHLIRVTDKKPETMIAYDDSKEQIKRYLQRERIQRETRVYVEKLKEGADIRRFMEVEP